MHSLPRYMLLKQWLPDSGFNMLILRLCWLWSLGSVTAVRESFWFYHLFLCRISLWSGAEVPTSKKKLHCLGWVLLNQTLESNSHSVRFAVIPMQCREGCRCSWTGFRTANIVCTGQEELEANVFGDTAGQRWLKSRNILVLELHRESELQVWKSYICCWLEA